MMRTVVPVVFCVLLAAGHSAALDNGMARTPALGWAAWSGFYDSFTEDLIKEMAQAMITFGLRDAGYTYFLVDDADMFLGQRDYYGRLQADPKKYPSGLKAIGDYLHSLGFKYGLYTDLGSGGCGSLPGSLGFYDIDAQSFADWGADYIKIDTCGGGINYNSDSQMHHWVKMERALNATGRPMYISLCARARILMNSTGTDVPYRGRSVYIPHDEWTKQEKYAVGNSWLVEYINAVDEWYAESMDNNHCQWAGAPCGLITNIDALLAHGHLNESSPGGLIDADETEVCQFGGTKNPPGMTLSEYRVMFYVWAILPSALLLTFDVRTVLTHPDGFECVSMIRNPEVLAVNQDPAAIGSRLLSQGFTGPAPTTVSITYQVFGRKLSAKNTYAAVMLNRSNTTLLAKVAWADLMSDMNPIPRNATVRDLGKRITLGAFTDVFVMTVPPHDAVMISAVAA